MNEAERLARIFKALSADTRVRIVQLLKGRALCVGALSARLQVTQGAVSQHLRVLRGAALVVPEKRGYFVHYRLNEKTLARWREATGRFLGVRREDDRVLSSTGQRKGGETCAAKKRAVGSRRS